MPLLYEPQIRAQNFALKLGQTYRVSFRANIRSQLTAQEAIEKLKSFSWERYGLKLKAAKTSLANKLLTGYVEVQKTSAFFIITGAMLAAVIVPSALALVGTIVKAWTVVTIVHPLLSPGPLGLPMIIWIFVAAAGVLIPAVILLKRR